LSYKGEDYPVIVDDHLPCNKWNNTQFAELLRNKMWVTLLEKAWAKIHGSYYRIQGGFPQNVNISMTGLPAYCMKHNGDAEKLWERIRLSDGKDYALCACTPDHPDGDSAVINGIV